MSVLIHVHHEQSDVENELRQTGYRASVACAVTLLLFIPFWLQIFGKGALFSNLREDFVAYAAVLLPHLAVMIASTLAPGAFAFGLGVSVAVLAGIALAVMIPVGTVLILLKPDNPQVFTFILLGLGLLAAQFWLGRSARAGARATQSTDATPKMLGAALPLAYIAAYFLIVLPAQMGEQRRTTDAKNDALVREQMLKQRDRYATFDTVVATRENAAERLLFIDLCLGRHSPYPQHHFPPDLRVLGPRGDNCLDSVTASGSLGRWRVVYTPFGQSTRDIAGYTIIATDTTGVDGPILRSGGDTTARLTVQERR
jgi:hypothetical protein